ncbi:MAG: hypothetical protein HY360_07575 [Verrucomicrobia bacterium]|nr:hypothetical protein [Verrucomicrobiota bacterium]
MKHFHVYLQDGRVVSLRAHDFQRDGDQYVFDGGDEKGVQFFLVSAVTGIVEAPPGGIEVVPRKTRGPLI